MSNYLLVWRFHGLVADYPEESWVTLSPDGSQLNNVERSSLPPAVSTNVHEYNLLWINIFLCKSELILSIWVAGCHYTSDSLTEIIRKNSKYFFSRSVSFCIFSFNKYYLFRLLILVTRLIQYDCSKVQIFFYLLSIHSLDDQSVWLQVTHLQNISRNHWDSVILSWYAQWSTAVLARGPIDNNGLT